MSKKVDTKTVGSFPAFKIINAWSQLCTERLVAQGEAVSELWDHLRNPKPDGQAKYDFQDWMRDVSSIWERSYNFMEDLWFFPVRLGQEERPIWVSLSWSRKSAPDTTQDQVRLNARVDEDRNPGPTKMEMLGKDVAEIKKEQIKVSLENNRSSLKVTIEGLAKHPPPVGHYVGFVTDPTLPRPIAILFLTVTD
ncbi:MAG TPA: hypothetical protein VN914_12890 [Polyangia bacterium]|nr:hypothetical protein [Polyangia bacterium]